MPPPPHKLCYSVPLSHGHQVSCQKANQTLHEGFKLTRQRLYDSTRVIVVVHSFRCACAFMRIIQSGGSHDKTNPKKPKSRIIALVQHITYFIDLQLPYYSLFRGSWLNLGAACFPMRDFIHVQISDTSSASLAYIQSNLTFCESIAIVLYHGSLRPCTDGVQSWWTLVSSGVRNGSCEPGTQFLCRVYDFFLCGRAGVTAPCTEHSRAPSNWDEKRQWWDCLSVRARPLIVSQS